MQDRRGETLIELLMSTVLPIVGGVGAGLTLKSFTPLPLWACLVIGIPVGTVSAWVLFIGLVLLFRRGVSEPLLAKRERFNERTRDTFNDSLPSK